MGREYLNERGDLLPADERALIETWLDSHRKIWRVLGLRAGRLELAADGEEVTVPTEQALDHPVARGDLLVLLADFDERPGLFDADRIRDHLGLSIRRDGLW